MTNIVSNQKIGIPSHLPTESHFVNLLEKSLFSEIRVTLASHTDPSAKNSFLRKSFSVFINKHPNTDFVSFLAVLNIETNTKSLILYDAIKTLCEKNLSNAALEILPQVPFPHLSNAHSFLAKHLANQGDLTKAKEITEKIEDALLRRETLEYIKKNSSLSFS